MLLSSSDPPFSIGTMWSGTVAAVILPLLEHMRQRGSAASLRSRCLTAADPRLRTVSLDTSGFSKKAA